MGQDVQTVTMRDVRELQYCSRGVRKFCEDRGLSYDKLLKQGITFEELRDGAEDAMVDRLIAHAEKRNAS